MSSPSISLPSRRTQERERTGARALSWAHPELLGLLVLAAVLDLWALDRNGMANEYYAAAVRSMSTSWHAFFYGSFDIAGVMTVDKPPLATMVQALSVRVFGFSTWSMLVPQALMGVATVGLAYDMTRRRFGRAGAFAAGLVLVLTPITVAMSRHNNPDALLVLCITAALWFVVRGLEDGKTKWLVWAGVAVGLGFEAKMGAALLVVPAIVAAWLWVAPGGGRLRAARQLVAGGVVMTVVGLAWPLLMWLTPASDRPWISGTSDNSIWSLITGYNGLGRVFGQQGGPGGGGPGGGGGGGGAAGVFGGDPGALRLLNAALGGQAGWLLGAALVGGLGIAVMTRLRRTDARTGWIIAVGGAWLVTAVAFSDASGIFHPYYVSAIAPFTAVLVGGTVGETVRDGRFARMVAPAALVGALVTEVLVLRDSATGLQWLLPVLGLVVGGAAIALAIGTSARGRAVLVAAAMAVLLVAPASWAVQTLGHATSSTFPAGGPTSQGMGMGGPRGGGGGFPGGGPGGGGGGFGGGGRGLGGGNTATITEAVAYAEAHGGGTVVVSSQNGGASQLVAQGADVAAIGGFSGRESQVSIAWLADAVESGQIRWVVSDGANGGMPNDARVGSTTAMAAVQQVGTQTTVSGLYDLQGQAAALRALAA